MIYTVGRFNSRRMPTAKEIATTRCNKLVDHAILILVDTNQCFWEIFQKEGIVMFLEWSEKIFVSFICRNEYSRSIYKNVLDIPIDLIGTYASLLELKVYSCMKKCDEYKINRSNLIKFHIKHTSSSNMECIKVSIPVRIIL